MGQRQERKVLGNAGSTEGALELEFDMVGIGTQ